jgi:hypothetical protein
MQLCMGGRVDNRFQKNINASLHFHASLRFHDASLPPSAMIFSLPLLPLLIVTSLAAPIFYLEGSLVSLFFYPIASVISTIHIRSRSFMRRSQYQRHRRLKAPGGKLQDRSGVGPTRLCLLRQRQLESSFVGPMLLRLLRQRRAAESMESTG